MRGYVRTRRLTIRVIQLSHAYLWHKRERERRRGGSHIARFGDSAWERTSTEWAVVGDVFYQLNRGFRQEEVNVHRLSGRTSLRELSPCVYLFTFTGSSNRHFHSDSGQ